MKKLMLFFAAMLMGLAAQGAGTLTVNDIGIYDMCVNKRVWRISDDAISLGTSGPGLEATVSFSASGLAGRRVLISVEPLTADGCEYADGLGVLSNTVAVTVPSDSYSGKVKVALPYGWVITKDNKELKSIKLGVTMIEPKGEVIDSKEFALDASKINVDKKNLPDKLMGDMFGSPSDIAGGLLGALFDTSDASAETDCGACDGQKICPFCDGVGFIDPSACRKCSKDPGVCRRCKGEGTETVKFNIY